MKTIKELEAEQKNWSEASFTFHKISGILKDRKDVLELIDELNTKSASGRERPPVCVLEELKARITG